MLTVSVLNRHAIDQKHEETSAPESMVMQERDVASAVPGTTGSVEIIAAGDGRCDDAKMLCFCVE